MKTTKTDFDAEMLKQIPDLSESEEDEQVSISNLAIQLDWFLEELKQELKVAVTQKNKTRTDELVAKIAEVQAERDDVWAALPTATTPPKNKPKKKESTTKKDLNVPAPTKSMQFDLFRQFTTNYENDVSNSLELWDSIPKYFLTPAQVKGLRTDDGLAKPAHWEYVDRDGNNEVTFSVKISPALLGEKGNEKAYFPGPTEELIEEVLKKFLLDQQLGLHDVSKNGTWVRFSLNNIERELALRGKSRSKGEIRHALEVMEETKLTWTRKGQGTYKTSIISEVIKVDREKYEKGGTDLWMARLPTLVSESINKLKYRQFNYLRLMDLGDSLSRWIYKRLINKYKQAAMDAPYSIHFKTVKQLSALLQQKDDRGNRQKMLSALSELKAAGVLSEFKIEEIKTGRAVIDVKYTLTPSDQFIKEQKAANKRQSDASLKAQQEGIALELNTIEKLNLDDE